MNIDRAIKSALEHYNTGKLDDAERLCRKILKRQPKNADILNLFGLIHCQRKEYDSAMQYIEKSLTVNPSNAFAQNNLGFCLSRLGRGDDALGFFEKALELNPYIYEAWENKGEIFYNRGLIDEAMNYFQKALQLNHNEANAWNNVGTCLLDMGKARESIQYFQKAIQIKHHFPDAHFNLGVAMLLLGDFKNGWFEYMWRWGFDEYHIPNWHQPIWDGSEFTGKKLFIHAEQGLGDMIQFVRYIPLVANRGGKIILQCHKELLPLIKNIEGVGQTIAREESLPVFDIHCPLLCLPMIFNTNLNNIPAQTPYIKADSILVKKWGERIKKDKSPIKVGLAWAGNTVHKKDRYRSIALEEFDPLGGIRGVTFYSLQKGTGSEQATNPPSGMKLIDYMDEVIDFSDTAALIENLDLVISVDTSVAHLAGAMGKPVWTLIQYSPDWRWMLDREDSPWYPTMRLLRQSAIGDWNSVINKVSQELRELCERKEPILIQEQSEEESTDVTSQPSAVEEQTNIEERTASNVQSEAIAIILQCEGMGDCLFAISVIKKIHLIFAHASRFMIFTHHPNLFRKCPYVEKAFSIHDMVEREKYKKTVILFDTSKLAHWTLDTFDFISIPAGIGGLSFREKQLEYFPVEEDQSKHFDVVINTSVTWPSRSWPIESWQRVADFILEKGYSIAVVGKDTYSKADNMWKKSFSLKGCIDLTNKLSLDQTYYTIKNCDLFVTCQNGLSVLSGATDTEIIVLDMSIEWSKRAIYRNEDPHYKVSYVKGNCMIYCCSSFECKIFGEFRCIPTVEQVLEAVKEKIAS
jgi:Tfp pilus assembly protein PilF/ADP-heptose:LPS heptosyltransferase